MLKPSIYSKKIRNRVCGLLIEDQKLLLIKHRSIGELDKLWLPPGGGIEFGETSQEALMREFKEETNLDVSVGRFLFTYEFQDRKHHAIELFYQVKRVGGELRLGNDPELGSENQIMESIEFKTMNEINKMDPKLLHGIFRQGKPAESITEYSGLVSFKY